MFVVDSSLVRLLAGIIEGIGAVAARSSAGCGRNAGYCPGPHCSDAGWQQHWSGPRPPVELAVGGPYPDLGAILCR